MTITGNDLFGSLSPDQDLVLPAQPGDPEMRESTSVWLYEESGAFGFPRFGIEAEGHRWQDRLFQGAFTFPDGRALNGSGNGPAPSPFDDEGRPAIIGAGPLTFRCIEPFRRWTMTYDGTALEGHVTEQIAGTFGHRGSTPVRLHVDMTMVTPAWVQELSSDISSMSQIARENAEAMGLGYRFEHHLRAVGTFEIDGKSYEFKGSGTRIHRQSTRRLGGFYGHSWTSAVFPNGDAFGCLVYPPRPETGDDYSYNDAVIYKDGRLYKARAITAPLLQRIVPSGDEFTIELESELGRTVIEGKTALSSFKLNHPIEGFNLQQGGAEFRWGDQRAFGMVERSSPANRTVFA